MKPAGTRRKTAFHPRVIVCLLPALALSMSSLIIFFFWPKCAVPQLITVVAFVLINPGLVLISNDVFAKTRSALGRSAMLYVACLILCIPVAYLVSCVTVGVLALAPLEGERLFQGRLRATVFLLMWCHVIVVPWVLICVSIARGAGRSEGGAAECTRAGVAGTGQVTAQGPTATRARMYWALAVGAILCVLLFVLLWCRRDPTVETVELTTDQTKLARIALEAEGWRVRRTAVRKLTDQAPLVRIAMEEKNEHVRCAAVEKLTDQALLAKVAVEAKDWPVRRAAAMKLTDQALLAKIVVEDEDSRIRYLAVMKLTDRALLVKVAVEARESRVRHAAVRKLTDQALLGQRAEKEPEVAMRRVAVTRRADDRLLAQRLAAEPSAAVRAGIVTSLREKDSLRVVACTAYHQNDRALALQRLKSRQDPAADVVAAHRTLERKVDALTVETDRNRLLTVALEGELDVLRAAAARRLSDPAAVEQAAMRASDREVLSILLAKLADKAMVNRIAAAAEDRAMRLTAAQKAGAKSWKQIFEAARAKGATVQMLGDALAAVSLFSKVQPAAAYAVRRACLSLIRRGDDWRIMEDDSRIMEMVDLLEGYGHKRLAEEYVKSGQPDLEAAGRDWARRRK